MQIAAMADELDRPKVVGADDEGEGAQGRARAAEHAQFEQRRPATASCAAVCFKPR
jgi:hypothetical protein